VDVEMERLSESKGGSRSKSNSNIRARMLCGIYTNTAPFQINQSNPIQSNAFR
jgi:hypothetical protein